MELERIRTGVRNLDQLLGGGLPRGSVTVVGGTPGAGKTTLAQQICFHNASKNSKALIFQTLSEPSAKTMMYMSQFEFFDQKKLNDVIQFVDLGGILRSEGIAGATKLLFEHIKRVKPSFVVIDSFKVFDDLAETKEELRKFTYEVAVQLMAWEITGFLLGEYSTQNIEESSLSSVVDGIIILKAQDTHGESQRFLKILKMRGTDHDRNFHPFSISDQGVEVYNPTLQSSDVSQSAPVKLRRLKSGVIGLDQITQGGIPKNSVTLLSGVSGTGKTLFLLESIYRAAQERDEKGIIISFEESQNELLTHAREMGWDLNSEIERKMIKIIFIPQSQILIEKNMETLQEEILKTGAQRVAIDSLTVFLEKIEKPFLLRQKVFQIASIIKASGAMGILTMDIQFSGHKFFRVGSPESVVDAIFHLGLVKDSLDRKRFFEILKMRNTAHGKGRFPLDISSTGIKILTSKS
jgi:circadian clock protein KaiC